MYRIFCIWIPCLTICRYIVCCSRNELFIYILFIIYKYIIINILYYINIIYILYIIYFVLLSIKEFIWRILFVSILFRILFERKNLYFSIKFSNFSKTIRKKKWNTFCTGKNCKNCISFRFKVILRKNER